MSRTTSREQVCLEHLDWYGISLSNLEEVIEQKNRQYQILTVKPLQPYTHTSHFTTMPCKLNAKINTKKSIYCWKTHPCTNNKVHNLKV